MDSPNKGPATRKLFLSDDIIMLNRLWTQYNGVTWASRRIKSPATSLKGHEFVPIKNKANIKDPCHRLVPCEGNPLVTGGFPYTPWVAVLASVWWASAYKPLAALTTVRWVGFRQVNRFDGAGALMLEALTPKNNRYYVYGMLQNRILRTQRVILEGK